MLSVLGFFFKGYLYFSWEAVFCYFKAWPLSNASYPRKINLLPGISAVLYVGLEFAASRVVVEGLAMSTLLTKKRGEKATLESERASWLGDVSIKVQSY